MNAIRARYTALPHLDSGNGSVSEEAVYALYNFRKDMLHHRGMSAFDDHLQCAIGFLTHRKADGFGFRHRSIAAADDFVPPADHAALHKTEAAESGAANLGHQVCYRLGSAAARTAIGLRLAFSWRALGLF